MIRKYVDSCRMHLHKYKSVGWFFSRWKCSMTSSFLFSNTPHIYKATYQINFTCNKKFTCCHDTRSCTDYTGGLNLQLNDYKHFLYRSHPIYIQTNITFTIWNRNKKGLHLIYDVQKDS